MIGEQSQRLARTRTPSLTHWHCCNGNQGAISQQMFSFPTNELSEHHTIPNHTRPSAERAKHPKVPEAGADVVVAQFRVANCAHSGPAPGPQVLSIEHPLLTSQYIV